MLTIDGSLCSPGGEEGLEAEDGGDGGGVICWGVEVIGSIGMNVFMGDGRFEDMIAGGMGFVES